MDKPMFKRGDQVRLPSGHIGRVEDQPYQNLCVYNAATRGTIQRYEGWSYLVSSESPQAVIPECCLSPAERWVPCEGVHRCIAQPPCSPGSGYEGPWERRVE